MSPTNNGCCYDRNVYCYYLFIYAWSLAVSRVYYLRNRFSFPSVHRRLQLLNYVDNIRSLRFDKQSQNYVADFWLFYRHTSRDN